MNPNELTPEEAKAALGNASYLQEQLLNQQNPQEMGIDDSQTSEMDLNMEPQMQDTTDIEQMVAERVKEEVDRNMEEIRKMLKEALYEEKED